MSSVHLRSSRGLFRRFGVLALVSIGFSLSAAPRSARAWGTAEHVQFGMQIDDPFEQLLGDHLPVLIAWPDPQRPGPRTFGHWVSAPDYARGLVPFLDRVPIVGAVACAALSR